MKLIKKLNTRRAKSGCTIRWGLFLCKYCNQEVERQLNNGLRNKSCGCVKNKLTGKGLITHGCACKGRITKLYNIWGSMKNRCYNPNNEGYENYGGRGIRVCKQWEMSFIIFKTWALSNGYRDNLTIERMNNNGNYESDNCKWATKTEQSYNKRSTKLNMVEANQIRSLYFNVKIKQALLAKIFGVLPGTILLIVNNKQWVSENKNYQCPKPEAGSKG